MNTFSMLAIQDSLSEIEGRVIHVEHARNSNSPNFTTDINSQGRNDSGIMMVLPPVSEANSQLSIDPLERAFMHENSMPVRIGGSQGVAVPHEGFDVDQLMFPRLFCASSAHIFES